MFHRFIYGRQGILSSYISYSIFLLKCPFSCVLTCRYFKLIMWPNLSNFLFVFFFHSFYSSASAKLSHIYLPGVFPRQRHILIPQPAGCTERRSANTSPLCIPQYACPSARTLSMQSTAASFSGHSY